ncbi:C39 family peptidase [Paenibacillus sp. MMS20-IR301]|uniref:C39 family peptidase n=1 Tax=Paenibacillus sp. MMS20-IR301 TaxID=2895946 RepID=UPI0028EB3EAF|nr:C39 family peptidase [Paenibacillus sp. MMS20-IR301]WNS41903.1 C39 family peptidase [Paenibacillus sp. MMS20-IR301]
MSRDRFSRVLKAEPYTQWEAGVEASSSACGPATMAALMEYWHTRKGRLFIRGNSHFDSKAAHINYIYTHHGGTPWGMSVGGFIRGLRAYIREAAPRGADKSGLLAVSSFNDAGRYRSEIDAGRPVALKFDKWFSFRWRGKYVFDYHWVLGIGYEDNRDGTLMLIVHDNGIRHKGRGYTPGRERRIPYAPNQPILTMVAVHIAQLPEPGTR